MRALAERSSLLLDRLAEVEQAMAVARSRFDEVCLALGRAALRSAALTPARP